MVRPSMRGGVPVFRRPVRGISSRRRAASCSEGGSPARPPAKLLEAHVDAAAEEGAGGQHHGGARRSGCRMRCVTPATRPPAKVEIGHFLLEHLEPGLRLHRAANGLPVQLAIGLRARGAHRRTLAGIERAELDAGRVGGPRHHAAQRIDLAHQVALADAADGRIAAHAARRSRCSGSAAACARRGAPRPAPLRRRHARRPPR